MPIVGLVVVVCSLLLLAVALPAALVAGAAVMRWAAESGFVLVLAIAAGVIALLVWLDPRERRLRKNS